jgi:hypothetical protein
MNKNYFSTDSTGNKEYFQKDVHSRKITKENKKIKDFSISTDAYKKSLIKIQTIHYEIKD